MILARRFNAEKAGTLMAGPGLKAAGIKTHVHSTSPHNAEPLAVANGCEHSIKFGRCYVCYATLEEQR
jgi:hypothetical protein